MLLFLGSGVSFDSGMPGVEILTDNVIDGDTDLYRAAVAIDENSRASSDLSKVQDLFRLLRDLDENYMEKIAPYQTKHGYDKTGSIARKKTNYENLFFYVEQILACGQGLSDNASSASFIDTIVRQAGSWLKSEESRNAEPEDLDAALNVNLFKIARQAKGFIEWTVAAALGPTDPNKMDYIVDFAKMDCIPRLDIATLNHDTLVESLLTRNSIEFIDGFGPVDGDVRWRDDSLYDNENFKIRIVKPHGSINWYSFGSGVPSDPAIVVNGNPANCVRGDGRALNLVQRMPSFLSGSNKVVSYNKGIYTDVFYRLHQLFRDNKLIVMCGYGWGDTAINFRITNWLDTDHENRIVLFHDKPEEIQDKCVEFAMGYRSWVKTGRLVLYENFLGEATKDDLKEVAAISNG